MATLTPLLVRLSASERASLEARAERWGVSLAEAVRLLVRGEDPPPRGRPACPDLEDLISAAGSRRAAAALLDVGEDLVGRWRSGERPLPAHRLEQIRSVLGSAEDGH